MADDDEMVSFTRTERDEIEDQFCLRTIIPVEEYKHPDTILDMMERKRHSLSKTYEHSIKNTVRDFVMDWYPTRARSTTCPREIFAKPLRTTKRLSLPCVDCTKLDIEAFQKGVKKGRSMSYMEQPPPSYRSILHLTLMDAPPDYTDATGKRVSFGLVPTEEVCKRRPFFSRSVRSLDAPSAGRFVIIVILIIVIVVTIILILATTMPL